MCDSSAKRVPSQLAAGPRHGVARRRRGSPAGTARPACQGPRKPPSRFCGPLSARAAARPWPSSATWIGRRSSPTWCEGDDCWGPPGRLPLRVGGGRRRTCSPKPTLLPCEPAVPRARRCRLVRRSFRTARSHRLPPSSASALHKRSVDRISRRLRGACRARPRFPQRRQLVRQRRQREWSPPPRRPPELPAVIPARLPSTRFAEFCSGAHSSRRSHVASAPCGPLGFPATLSRFSELAAGGAPSQAVRSCGVIEELPSLKRPPAHRCLGQGSAGLAVL